MDSKDMKAVQSALSEVDTSQRSVLDSTVSSGFRLPLACQDLACVLAR